MVGYFGNDFESGLDGCIEVVCVGVVGVYRGEWMKV